ncbi:hypothetical protein [Streptomyces sp. NBC_00448]|uniref:hypothetical protein n=1 Tax=Streptomyces sp. NBC_00448 TaxID=2903652 RepID=UPI002E231F73
MAVFGTRITGAAGFQHGLRISLVLAAVIGLAAAVAASRRVLKSTDADPHLRHLRVRLGPWGLGFLPAPAPAASPVSVMFPAG